MIKQFLSISICVFVATFFCSNCSNNNTPEFNSELAHAASLESSIPLPEYYGVYIWSDTNELTKLIHEKLVIVHAKEYCNGFIFYGPSPRIDGTRLTYGVPKDPSLATTHEVFNTGWGMTIKYRDNVFQVKPIGKDMYFVNRKMSLSNNVAVGLDYFNQRNNQGWASALHNPKISSDLVIFNTSIFFLGSNMGLSDYKYKFALLPIPLKK